MNNLKDLYKLIICVTWAGRGGRGVSEKEQERDQQAGSAAGGGGGDTGRSRSARPNPLLSRLHLMPTLQGPVEKQGDSRLGEVVGSL